MPRTMTKKVIFLIWMIGLVQGEEPKCTSRFDYDEQMLMKLLRLEDQVNKFRDFIDDMKAREAEEMVNRQRLMQEAMEQFKVNTNTAMEEIANNTRELREKINIGITKIKSARAPTIAFTASEPVHGDAILKFTKIITNEGGDYDVSTGRFTCRFPGLYFFIIQISADNNDEVDSQILKNGSRLTRAYSGHSFMGYYRSSGVFAVSTSVYVVLDVGDVITVGQSGSGLVMYKWSSFSGALITGK